jgi:tetratricopeptide (TPR) repeat protein
LPHAKAVTLLSMRKLAVGLLLLAAACTPSLVPVPVVTTPKFPEYTQPPVPQALAVSKATPRNERAWKFFQAGDARNADVEIAAALKLDPGFFPAETLGGYLDLTRKDPKGALSRFDKALELSGTYTPALVGRGEALVAMDREAEAIAAFGAALAVDPNRTDLQRRIEVLRFRGLERNLASAREAAKAGRSDDARRAYQSAIESSPESAFLYRELGAVERQAGASDLALSHFRKAVDLDPGDPGSVAQIGELLEATGDDTGALEAYNKSLALEPNDRVETRRDALIAKAELAKLPEEYRAIESATEVTRGDLAALIGVRLNALVLAMRSREPVVVTDVRGSWAENWISAVARAGVIEPYANHTFQPRATVRRADLAQAASRLLARVGTPEQLRAWQNARAKFADISQGHLAYPAASMAVAAGVMSTTPDGSFLPSRLVTGDEAVQTIQRLQTMADSAARRDAAR